MGLNFAAAFAFQSKVGLIQESISNGIVLVMASHSGRASSVRSAKGDGAKRLLLWRAEQRPVNHWQSLDGEDGLGSSQSQRSGPLFQWRRRRLVIVMWPRALAGHPNPLTSPRFLASPSPLSRSIGRIVSSQAIKSIGKYRGCLEVSWHPSGETQRLAQATHA
ncbi:hypothetical protein TGAM01_v203232 [Trichoderma gamsii]|uniref:Uncharacterized protein n=1 Tax=Trichoderma gamsii TaxID=398673 RepID=A0A2P4ZUY2_9HYPO|nr:hypothetical protein TGAM01_v203232 [Trichoderma gamsii]PON28095.1 hypothetical protein TGAM01_v203232 [Trichoderma gamsii]